MMILEFALLMAQVVEPPSLGYLEVKPGEWREIVGVQGNFLLGPALEEGVRSAAMFDGLKVVKTASELKVTSGGTAARMSTVDGPAQFSWDQAGRSLQVFLPEEKALFRWKDGSFARLPSPETDGVIVAMTNRREGVSYLVRSEQRYEMVTAGERSPVESSGPAVFDSSGNLWTSEGAAVRCAGTVRELGEPALAIQPLTGRWVAVRTESAFFAARCDAAEVYLLPIAP